MLKIDECNCIHTGGHQRDSFRQRTFHVAPALSFFLLSPGLMGDDEGTKLKRGASVTQVWQHATQEASAEAIPFSVHPEERAALILGLKWREKVQRRTALSRTRLIERLQLEESVKIGMLRMLFFLLVFFFNLLLTSIDVSPEYKLQLRNNLR